MQTVVSVPVCEKVDEDFCAKQFNTDPIRVYNAAGCVRCDTATGSKERFTCKFSSDMFGTFTDDC